MPRGRPLIIPWQEDAATPRTLYQRERDSAFRARLHALWLLRAGHPMGEVAALPAVHYVTVQGWVRWYRQGGLADVQRRKRGGGRGRASFLTAAQLDQLQHQAQAGTFRTAADVQQWLAAQFQIHYSRGGIYNLLARRRWKPKVPVHRRSPPPPRRRSSGKRG